ncbi:unnamed protein product [Gongylonema pulchrum]|uniref:Ribonuclease PIN domain-containing protein n=1 Tax=Gongylonema pulchrum TaxID=637853 RepID=A0A3P7NPI0_9BILA|nr:unnamed protein product [Gongylonema pulchrum]
MAYEVYTVEGVVSELKCPKTRHFIENLLVDLIIREPSAESLRIMTEVSKKTGDYPSLSAVDLKVIALLHDLHVEEYGKESLNYDCPVKNSNAQQLAGEKQKDTDAVVDKSAVDDLKMPSITEKMEEGTEDDKDNADSDNDDNESSGSSSDAGTWLNEENVDEILGHIGEVAVPERNMKVACITTDFAMQNVLLRLGLNLLSIDGYRIRQLKSYILR